MWGFFQGAENVLEIDSGCIIVSVLNATNSYISKSYIHINLMLYVFYHKNNGKKIKQAGPAAEVGCFC